MFAANPATPTYPAIQLLGAAGQSEPLRRPPATRQKARLVAAGGVMLAAVVAAFGAGFMAGNTGALGTLVTDPVTAPMPGEFRLGPGNGQPPGITVPLD